MATPRSPATVRPITITPKSRILDVSSPSTNAVNTLSLSHSDDFFSKRLRDSGLDEDSIRRRDKAALIAYIAKLEAEIYELQHNMGLLILERKDYASKYEEARLASESVKSVNARDQAALTSALSESNKRVENLKKALGVEKECVSNIEKALHETRAECAESKVAAESKMAEAKSMIEDAQRKYSEVGAKLHALEALLDESKRRERSASSKLREVEAREDDLRRRIVSFKTECDAKEKELMSERQSLLERQKIVSEGHNKLLDGQALLNQRETDIVSKDQELRRMKSEVEAEKEKINAERESIMEKKSYLELTSYSLSEREKIVIEKEALLMKKEQELFIAQENLTSKENSETQRIIAEQERMLSRRRDEFEADLLVKQKLVEEEIESKRRTWELKELDLKLREDLALEKEQELEVQSRLIIDKGKDLTEKIKSLTERENYLNKSEAEVRLMKTQLQKERDEIDEVKIELEKSLLSLEGEKKRFAESERELKLMKSETSELLIWESKLKDEIDTIRAQNAHLEAEAERLKVEKAKFESEWEFMDEKREELKREEECIAKDRMVISKFLKDERDSLNEEKESLREQYKRYLESLSRDQEASRSQSQREHAEWFSKFEQEREGLLLDIECRKRELEDRVSKRREDIERYLREKEEAFEEEKKRELERIGFLKEEVMREREVVASELKKVEAEKLEIRVDNEQRQKAWAELQSLIEELRIQRLKLKQQRELLHAESAHKVTLSEDGQVADDDSPLRSSTVPWIKNCASLISKNHMETKLVADCEEPKVIREVPFVTDICDLQATESEHNNNSISASFGTSGGRKRRVDDPSVTGIDSVLPDVGKVNKKRRKVDVGVPDSSQDVALEREINDAGKLHSEMEQNVVDNEGLRCVVVKQTVMQEVVVMDGEVSDVSLKKAIANKPKDEGQGGPLDTELKKPVDNKERVVKTRSKSKQKM